MKASGILTLTTDFGSTDAYVAAMKGVMLQAAPDVRLIDITHGIAPQDVMQAAFVLRGAIPSYPAGTVHLAVVDPETGTARRPIAARSGTQYFVGPDNGIFSLVFQGAVDEAVILDRPAYWADPEPGPTSHGRDIFGPVAARIASGTPLTDVGSPVEDLARLHWALPITDDQGVRGWIVHVDSFGNCIANIPMDAFESGRRSRRFKCYVGNVILDVVAHTYADVAPGEPVLLFNSSGLLEIAVYRGSASELLNIRAGAPINIVFLDERA